MQNKIIKVEMRKNVGSLIAWSLLQKKDVFDTKYILEIRKLISKCKQNDSRKI